MAKEIKVGDSVQWTSQGVAQFSKPRIVTSIYDYPGTDTFPAGKYALVEGTFTGLPVNELTVVRTALWNRIFSHAVNIWDQIT